MEAPESIFPGLRKNCEQRRAADMQRTLRVHGPEDTGLQQSASMTSAPARALRRENVVRPGLSPI